MIGNQPKFKYVYLGLDVLVLITSFIIAVSITIPKFWHIERYDFQFYYSYISLFSVLLCIYLFTFLYNDLYKRHIVLSRYLHFAYIAKALIIAGALSIFLMAIYNINFLVWRGKQLFINISIIDFVLFTVLRIFIAKIIFQYISSNRLYKRKILIVGSDEAGKKVCKELQKDPIKDFQIVGFLDDYKKEQENICMFFNNLGTLKNIKSVVIKNKVNEIIIAIDDMPYERLVELVHRCSQACKTVRIYSNFLDVIDKKLHVEQYSNIPVIMLSEYTLSDFTWQLKHIFDKVFAVFLTIIFIPLFLVVAIGIKISSKGPIIFKQIRIGKGGKPFSFYKFRSMHIHDDDSEHEKFVKNVWFQQGNQDDKKDIKIFRITDDPRVFKFGKFIRKMSLDELPQLINVIKGDMSLVGPRPCMPFEWEMYDGWHKNRLKILPGCTGLWQALGRATVSFDQMVILDLYYISNMTLWLDLKIFFKTIPVLLFGKGGH
jgi:undecaprenyl-phosphate galactose phosphotransferase